MKIIFIFIVQIAAITNAAFPQNLNTKTEILSDKDISNIFTDSIKGEFKLDFPIFRVYKYADKSGEFLTALTESRDSIGLNQDTANFKIKAVTFKFNRGRLTKIWDLNDLIDKKNKGEQSIWFWTKYVEFNEFDNDSIIEPIVVYASVGLNGYYDGRIKIVVYYKGQKIWLRHQNGTFDDERKLQIDKAFYSLPPKLQSNIRHKMQLMVESQQAMFPYGWQQAMQQQKTMITERNH